jgi:HPt (histidine-containing phosphotransfer) domain-containing protein
MSDSTSADTLLLGELPALDLEVLSQIELLGKDAGVDLVGQLAVVFLADARLRVIELRRAMIASDAGALTRSAHNLNGSSATLGATRLARLCAELETRGGSISPMLRIRLLAAIEVEIERVRSAFAARTTSEGLSASNLHSYEPHRP